MKCITRKFIIVLLIILSVSAVGVGALTLCNAKDIDFNPNDESWDVETIEDALNELYEDTITDSCKGGVAVPNLGSKGNLIPVTISGDGTVKYAILSEKWYDYCNKEWANAVILKDSPSKTYKAGDTILESDIESYFVWVPKYKYKLWNTDNAIKKAHIIDVVFDTTNTTDEEGVSCETPMLSGDLGNCNNGEYMTHPSFISMGVDGFWVGKFETGYANTNSRAEAEKLSNDSTKIVIKPNIYSWRFNTIANIFESSYNYDRHLDSHMMKNTEWGAVAYLSHSKYGYGNRININNNSEYKTGYSALPSTNQQIYPGNSGNDDNQNNKYNTSIGYLASTTGNITGIYDMSGGSHEYVAAHISENFGLSELTADIVSEYDTKYFDIYSTESTIESYEYMILGDATGEMGPFLKYGDSDSQTRIHNSWYNEVSYFLESARPWFYRSGLSNYGTLGGIFFFYRSTGDATENYGSRIVLAP